ncbi:hypothetical protein HDV00_011874 [Rhizophlyctis rosea]|nr:hypothetical protein HDV00_011874 [Rhizophlyctis rosea]
MPRVIRGKRFQVASESAFTGKSTDRSQLARSNHMCTTTQPDPPTKLDGDFKVSGRLYYLNHHCPSNLCGQDPKPSLVFLKFFNAATMTLTYVGSLHVQPEDIFSTHLPTIRQLLGPWGAGHELRFWEDIHEQRLSRIDTNRTCDRLALETGDIIVIQNASEEVIYPQVCLKFKATDGPMMTVAKKWPVSDYLATLWKDQIGADVTVTYGDESHNCHRLILSRAPYFNTLFTTTGFANIGNTISLPDELDPHAVELVLEYLYINDFDKLFHLDSDSTLAVIRVLDFLCMMEEVRLLAPSVALVGCSEETLIDALELGSKCLAGGALLKSVAVYMADNSDVVEGKGLFAEYLASEPNTYSVLIEEVQKEFPTKKIKK